MPYICLVSFLYPLFLLAGLTVSIPILIHLFNLRRYKTVYFPNTRFLKNIQLHSQKQSQVRYKLLLTLRILFLLSLVLAFAQPLFNQGAGKEASNRLQVIYLDNSNSMSVKKGTRNLLELGKEAVRKQLKQASPDAKFVLLTNDRLSYSQPVTADKLTGMLQTTELSAVSRTPEQVFRTVQGILQSEGMTSADLYYYSDFQKAAFPTQPTASLLKSVRFTGIPVGSDVSGNVFIDTAVLLSPVIQTGQKNQLVIYSRISGKAPKDDVVLQLSVNGQVKTAGSLRFGENKRSVDTLGFQVTGPGWQELSLTVNDQSVHFDDTFRIAAKSASNLSVLVLNESQPNPYIQAAFRAYEGFFMDQRSTDMLTGWERYNLIILNGITSIEEKLATQVVQALQSGQSILIFPGKAKDPAAFGRDLKRIADISIQALDTMVQQATAIQQGSELVRDLFESIPPNVQLPVANWHYSLDAGLSANQQTILSFRNGDPFLAQYMPYRGKLYVCATSADLQSGNFPGSYFFAPFLYQMTATSKGGNVFAIRAGSSSPVYLGLNNADERNMIHLYGGGTDVIPRQKPAGAGLEVYLDQAVQRPGFYSLTAKGSDSAVIGVNADRSESLLESWTEAELKKNWQGSNIRWAQIDDQAKGVNAERFTNFPLWKVCVILALLMLAAESYVLARSYREQTVVSS